MAPKCGLCRTHLHFCSILLTDYESVCSENCYDDAGRTSSMWPMNRASNMNITAAEIKTSPCRMPCSTFFKIVVFCLVSQLRSDVDTFCIANEKMNNSCHNMVYELLVYL